MTQELVHERIGSSESSRALGIESTVASSESSRALGTESNVACRFHRPPNKRVKLSSDQNGQEDDFESFNKQRRPIGLKLTLTPSFLNQLNIIQERTKRNTSGALSRIPDVVQENSLESQSRNQSERLKASNFPAAGLVIGTFKRFSVHEGDLVAKCYYAKRKLVWEVLEGPVKSKMEIEWSHIDAIRATLRENEPGILEIELNQQPTFFRETSPQPRKHTLWHVASDFTEGQALICRRHRLEFSPGILDKHYEKLLQCDQRLLDLSGKPFPSKKCPYFHPFPHHCNNNINLATDSSLQGQEDGDLKSYMYDSQGEIDQNIYFVQDRIQGLQLPANEKDPFEGYGPKVSQVILGDGKFPQGPPIHSYVDSSKTNTIINQLEYMPNNLNGDSSLSDSIEKFNPDVGVIWQLPINSVHEQVSGEDVTTVTSYARALSDPTVGVQGAFDTSYLGQQWS